MLSMFIALWKLAGAEPVYGSKPLRVRAASEPRRSGWKNTRREVQIWLEHVSLDFYEYIEWSRLLCSSYIHERVHVCIICDQA